MNDSHLPSSSAQLLVDVRGAEIVSSNSDDPSVLLPNHEEVISHIALDIGGSLAKVVYFTRAPKGSSNARKEHPATPPQGNSRPQTPITDPSQIPPVRQRTPSPPLTPAQPNGILGPKSLSQRPANKIVGSLSHLRRRSSTSKISSGGRLNFAKFETTDLASLISFLNRLIESSAASNRVPLGVMKRNVKIIATGGGAHMYHERLRDELGVEVMREEEMECLVLGLGFMMEVPNEVFWYSDELVQAISHPQATTLAPISSVEMERPSPNPPQYSLSFDSNPTPAVFPCLLVNIGSGVSIVKIDDYGKYERISGTSLGGGTLWGLLSLLTGAQSFDDMLRLADQGDNSSVDMLVGDIYGQDYNKIGLKSSTIASSFGKVFRKGEDGAPPEKKAFRPEDISRSLLYAISNNIGQIAYMNAEKHNLDRIYFSGGFIRGHAATISTLSYAIRFWSKGTKRAHFLRHEGYVGAIGAWLKNLDGSGTPLTKDVPLPKVNPA
ncbi:hypothetical protein ACM66B_002844 [Microbotryomycetes sp. NB124-2]